jgi:uncharacterized protein (TIGR02217 family)
MAEFIESRLLDEVANGFAGGPTWYTETVELRSGVIRRRAVRSRPRYRFSAPYQNISPAKCALVIAAFNACQGAARGFRFKDWADYSATAEAIGNTPGANSNPVQLYKSYTFGGTTVTRTIKKPVSGTVTVYSNGVAKAGTLDATTGLFTPTTAWTAGQALTWTGQFDVPVRFSSDELIFDFNTLNALSSNVDLEEIFY